jgi:hypothetical protein
MSMQKGTMMTARKQWFIVTAVWVVLLLVSPRSCLRQEDAGASDRRANPRAEFPGTAPGAAQGEVSENALVLENEVIAYVWDVSDRQLKPKSVTDKLSVTTHQLRQSECFELILAGGQAVKASDLKIVGEPTLKDLKQELGSCRLADQFGGKQIAVMLTSPDQKLTVQWRGILRDGSNYVRQQVAFTTHNEPIDIEEIVLVELSEPHVKVMGIVDGSPAVVGNMFFAYEHPLSKTQIVSAKPGLILSRLRCSLPYNAALKPGEALVQSSVVGVVPPRCTSGLRRGFLYYIERERAHPYRPFLHYNSWYDIGYGPGRIPEPEFLAVVELFGNELIKKRKVVMDSFVLDDGWDDHASLWQFHEGFPNGFSRLQKAANKYDSALGAWLSPWGGYGEAKRERLQYGQQQGFETNKSGFSLAGPMYYARFRDVCINMIRQYELNYFKFDGIGTAGEPTGAATDLAPDIQALLRLIGDMRQVKPNLFVNITTGTWPSPFWLLYGDSVWRAGSDWSTHGWGSKRQQQITYRDKETYHNVVLRAPLYPLNSLMTQGIMFANHGLPDETKDLVDDIRAFFASGTNCQELYITPSLMWPEAWDALAEAAKWSRDNADVLIDTHWIGGDPAEGQVYGWASWSKRKGILSLRNPRDKPGKITIDIGEVFQLPKGAAQKYSLQSPWKNDAGRAANTVSVGKQITFELKPFEVLVFDAKPL